MTLREDLAALPANVLGIGAWTIAALTGARYPRFLGLHAAAARSLSRGEFDEASARARELIDLAEAFKGDWNYGNAIHHGHLTLGRVALAQGDRAGAVEALLAAGRTPGSPQLDSFGPNMLLARDLIAAGERDAVIQYFALCRNFWKLDDGHLDAWERQVRDGLMPEFRGNLVY